MAVRSAWIDKHTRQYSKVFDISSADYGSYCKLGRNDMCLVCEYRLPYLTVGFRSTSFLIGLPQAAAHTTCLIATLYPLLIPSLHAQLPRTARLDEV